MNSSGTGPLASTPGSKVLAAVAVAAMAAVVAIRGGSGVSAWWQCVLAVRSAWWQCAVRGGSACWQCAVRGGSAWWQCVVASGGSDAAGDDRESV